MFVVWNYRRWSQRSLAPLLLGSVIGLTIQKLIPSVNVLLTYLFSNGTKILFSHPIAPPPSPKQNRLTGCWNVPHQNTFHRAKWITSPPRPYRRDYKRGYEYHSTNFRLVLAYHFMAYCEQRAPSALSQGGILTQTAPAAHLKAPCFLVQFVESSSKRVRMNPNFWAKLVRTRATFYTRHAPETCLRQFPAPLCVSTLVRC